MLTAPVLLSVTPESYNSTKLVFSSVYNLSDTGISFSINSNDYAGDAVLAAYPSFSNFFTAFNTIKGLSRRIISKDNLSPAHIQWFADNTFEILDVNYNSLDLNSNEYIRSVAKKVYNISVLSSVNGIEIDSGNSNFVSGDSPSLPLMYNKTYRNDQDWITVPLVSGRKAIYVAANGSDSNNGLASGTPKLTVSAAYNIMDPGDHLLFKRGGVWTNQAFGGTNDGLPSNLCADNKSGSSITCPTYIGTYGDASEPLPIFNITNSAITTFFFADNDEQYSGLKNFYVKCLHMTASGRDLREEANGHTYPSFFTLLNTGGSAISTGVSGDAISDNILIEGCRLEEICNAITIQSYYNSLVPGSNNTYGWGTSNFVSSYTTPATISNVLIRRNIFKDLYFIPAQSVSRANGLGTFLVNVFSDPRYQPAPTEAGSLYRYNSRVQALAAQGRQPKAIYMYGASGQSNIIEGNIFYRCGNKSETYPDTHDKLNATVLTEGGFAGVHIFRNLFYKCANIATMQLDGGANLKNIYFRNPQAIVMMADVGLYEKKQYQGVPTSETFPSVSGGLSVKAYEGNFVPYWYWFNKNNGLSVIAKNIIEEPQDIGYNAKSVSGDEVLLKRGAPEQTIEGKGTAIRILGGTVDIYNNYIGNISKGVCTALEGLNIKGFGRNILHWDRGANSILHEQTQFARQNKITFRDNTINNHGTLWIQTHNYINNFFNPLDPRPVDYLFEPSALTIKNNVFRNRFWNKNSPYNGAQTLQDFGVGYLTFYSDTMFSGTPKIVFANNKLGLNTGPNPNRGFNIFGRSNQSYNGEYSINSMSSVMNCLFGATNQERAATVLSNPRFLPQQLFSAKGDSTISLLESHLPNTAAPEENGGWSKFEPYNYGQPNGTRVFYVDPVGGNDNNAGTSPAAAFRNLKRALSLLQSGRPDWILLKRGTVFNLDELTNGQNGPDGPDRRHTNDGFNDTGIQIRFGGRSKQYPLILGAYGPDANPLTGNYFGSSELARPLLTRRLDGPASSIGAVSPGSFFYLVGYGGLQNPTTCAAKYLAVLDLHLSGINYAPPTAQNEYCRQLQHDSDRPMITLQSQDGCASGFLFEGLLLENWHSDMVVITNLINPRPPELLTRDILFRRCAFYLCFSYGSGRGLGRQANIHYGADTLDISSVECVFDGGGWHPHLLVDDNSIPNRTGLPSIFSHNQYYSGYTSGIVLANSISARAAATGSMLRGTSKFIENTFIRNLIGMVTNTAESGLSMAQIVALGLLRTSSEASRNLVIETHHFPAAGGNYGFIAWNGSGLTIDDNIFTKNRNDSPLNPVTVAVDLGAYGDSTTPYYFFPSSLVITNNIVYQWDKFDNQDAHAFYFKDIRRPDFFKFTGNKVLSNQTGNQYRAMHIEGGPYPANFSNGFISKSNNFGPYKIDYCPNLTTGCNPGYGGTPNLVLGASISAVISTLFNDNTSVFTLEQFPDPNRTVARYVDLVASEPVPDGRVLTPDGVAGPQSTKLEYFLVKARQNRKGAWDLRWTANSLNNYIREGFGKPPVGRVNTVEQMIQNSISNLTCNASSMNSNLLPDTIIDTLLNTSLIAEVIDADGGIPAPSPNPEDNVPVNPNYYSDDAELTLFNSNAQAVKVVLDPENPNQFITIPARKSLRIPYVERNEVLEEAVQRWNLAAMIRYNGLVFRAFGSIPAPAVGEDTPVPPAPIVD